MTFRRHNCPLPLEDDDQNVLDDIFNVHSKRSLRYDRYQSVQPNTPLGRGDIPLVNPDSDESKSVKKSAGMSS